MKEKTKEFLFELGVVVTFTLLLILGLIIGGVFFLEENEISKLKANGHPFNYTGVYIKSASYLDNPKCVYINQSKFCEVKE